MFNYTAKIRLQHTDAAGLLYFSRIFDLAHECYEAFLDEHISIGRIIQSGDFLAPIVHAQADYRKKFQVSETISIEMTLAKQGTSSFEFKYDIFNSQNQLAAEVTTIHVIIDKTTGNSKPIPAQIEKILKQL